MSLSYEDRRKIEEQAQKDAQSGDVSAYADIASHRRGHYFNPHENRAYQDAFISAQQEGDRNRKR